MAEIENLQTNCSSPYFVKEFGEIVYKQLIAHPQHHSLLFESQFGVRPTSCYTYFTYLISIATATVFIDSSKAFDTIIHSVIFRKLSSFGVYNVELRWCIDYLFLRKQINNLMVRFLNQILFTLQFLKEVFWGLLFFLSSPMCLVPFVIVRLSPIPMKQ